MTQAIIYMSHHPSSPIPIPFTILHSSSDLDPTHLLQTFFLSQLTRAHCIIPLSIILLPFPPPPSKTAGDPTPFNTTFTKRPHIEANQYGQVPYPDYPQTNPQTHISPIILFLTQHSQNAQQKTEHRLLTCPTTQTTSQTLIAINLQEEKGHRTNHNNKHSHPYQGLHEQWVPHRRKDLWSIPRSPPPSPIPISTNHHNYQLFYHNTRCKSIIGKCRII